MGIGVRIYQIGNYDFERFIRLPNELVRAVDMPTFLQMSVLPITDNATHQAPFVNTLNDLSNRAR